MAVPSGIVWMSSIPTRQFMVATVYVYCRSAGKLIHQTAVVSGKAGIKCENITRTLKLNQPVPELRQPVGECQLIGGVANRRRSRVVKLR